MIGALLAALVPALVWAADAPVPDKGDTRLDAHVHGLVLLMSVPALGSVLWRPRPQQEHAVRVDAGVRRVLARDGALVHLRVFVRVHGRQPVLRQPGRLFLNGTFSPETGAALGATFSKNTPMYELVFVAFQATFAAITCCLILGSIVERIKFSGVLLFIVLWFTFSYIPVAHMVWFWDGPDAYTDAAAAAEATVARQA